MITITNNYFQDLNTAIAAGIFPVNAKPKKAALYEAIAAHNQTVAVPTKKYEWVEVEVDRFDLPEGINRCDSVPGFHEWLAASSKYSRVEGGIHEGYVAYQLQRVEIESIGMSVAELEAAGDEVALSAALLAMDAAEDTAKAEQVPAKVKQPRKAPTDILTELAKISADVEAHGRQAIADQLGTSVGRLVKRIKAYKIMQSDERVRQAFINGKFTYSFLQEAAVRRDGLQLIDDRLQLSA